MTMTEHELGMFADLVKLASMHAPAAMITSALRKGLMTDKRQRQRRALHPSDEHLEAPPAPGRERAAFLDAVGGLDEEGFSAVAWMIYQTSKSAGGYRDKAGWLRVRKAAEALPAIAALEAKFDAIKSDLDKGPTSTGVDVKRG
jgi:hypothetical protein